jgi:hypothetical protein
MSSPFPLESKIAVFHRFVEASWKITLGRVKRNKASRSTLPFCTKRPIYIFHEASTNRWKTAILVSGGKGDDIISSNQWKTVLFVSMWAHEADTWESLWRLAVSIAPSLL